MKRKLRTRLTVGFILIVFIIIALISLTANLLINRQFERYVEAQQQNFADSLAEGLQYQYNAESDTWNIDYIHGVGMYALNDGYIIKLYDQYGNAVWDAENHDMTYCHQIMNSITVLMEENRPNLGGEFMTHEYALNQGETVVGNLEVSYYSPYYLNENAFQFLNALNFILLVVGTVSVFGAAFAAVILAKRICTSIVKTIQITKEISQGNYAIRFESETKTKELAELMQAVNEMTDALENQETLRKQLTTNVAHELRTPLTNVSSHLEAIIEGVWEPSRERLKSCYDEVRRLSLLISDLQRLSQAESYNLNLHKEPVSLLTAAQMACNGFEQELREKQISCSINGCDVEVLAEKRRIHQVITNLLSNAIKYSEEGGTICISVESDEKNSQLIVEDNGIGIPTEELPLVFERFYRTDKSRSRKTGGTGIGLAIVKSIVQSHGGTITAESETGKGSRFIVTIPNG